MKRSLYYWPILESHDFKLWTALCTTWLACVISVLQSTVSCHTAAPCQQSLIARISSTLVNWNTPVNFLDRTSRPSLSSFVLNRLDYCNAVLASFPRSIAPLQLVQNAAARFVARLAPRYKLCLLMHLVNARHPACPVLTRCMKYMLCHTWWIGACHGNSCTRFFQVTSPLCKHFVLTSSHVSLRAGSSANVLSHSLDCTTETPAAGLRAF